MPNLDPENAGLNERWAEPNLAQRSFTALKWNYIGAFARAGSQFAIGIVLARLLGPEPFGLVTIALLVVGLGALIADFGLVSALVQRKAVSREDIRFVFTIQVLVGAVLTLCVFLLSDSIADFFRRTEATSVLKAMSVMFLFQAFGQTASALLRRNLDFKKLQLAQFASYIVGYVFLGVPLAFSGVGVWSLVLAQVVQSGLFSLTVYALVRHPVMPHFRHGGGSLLAFGMKVMASNLASWGIANLDSAVVGRKFGVLELGLYNRAFTLVSTPMGVLVTSLQNVLFAATARAQDDTPALRRTYLGILGAMAFLCLPIFASVAAISDTVILGVYGEKWASAAPFLMPLSLAMGVNALLALGGPMMSGMGRAGQETWIQLLSLAVFALALSSVSRYPIEMVAWTVMATYLLRFALITAVTANLVGGNLADLVGAMMGPILVATFAAIVTYLIDAGLIEGAFPPLLRLTVAGLAGGVTSALLFSLLLRRRLVAEPTARMLDQLWARIPLARRFFVGA